MSHETIYLTLFIQARGALKRELIAHLRRTRSMRRPRGAKHLNRGQGHIRDAFSIREQTAEADDRAVPGHWEGDLLAGSADTHIATLVERHSRFVMLVAVDGKDTRSVTKALSMHAGRLPEPLRSSLTWDRGMKMAKHAQFTIATDVKVYFCDPKPLATRLQREHQRAPAPVPPQRHRPLAAHAAPARRHRRQAQHETPRNPPVQDTSRYPRRSVALTS